jgi:hypothetical protein
MKNEKWTMKKWGESEIKQNKTLGINELSDFKIVKFEWNIGEKAVKFEWNMGEIRVKYGWKKVKYY